MVLKSRPLARVTASVLILVSAFLLLSATPVWAATGDIDTVSGSAWTNGSITQPFTGIETDMAIGGNNGIEEVPAIEIANRQAMNGYGPGDYIFTTAPLIRGNGVNPDYVQHVLDQFGFTIVDQSTDKTNNGYYAGSDVYVLSGYDNAPNPYGNPYYYATGQYVHLLAIARPSIEITSAVDQTTGLSSLRELAPGDSVLVTDRYNTKDDAPSQWGHTGGILAYWYFHGVYTNAFADRLFDVPEYGFGPYQGNYQPGFAPADSLTFQVPHAASGKGELILYYVDGIDRFAEVTQPVSVASICPTMTFPDSQASGAQVATETVATVRVHESGGHAGDVIDWTASGGTFSGGTTHGISKLSASGFASVQVRQTPGDPTTTVSAVDASFATCSAIQEVVTWPTPPQITISASPTSLYADMSSTLSVHAVHLQVGEHVVVVQTDGAQGTLRDAGLSSQKQISYDVSQTYESYDYRLSARATTAQTLHFRAQVQNASGRALATATPVSITWQAEPAVPLSKKPTVTLVASSPTQPVNTSDTLTAVGSNLPADATIVFLDLRGHTLTTPVQSPPAIGGYDWMGSANSPVPTIDAFAAEVVSRVGQVLATSQKVSIRWTAVAAPTIATGDLTLRASALSESIGQTDTLIASTTYRVGKHEAIYLHDLSGDQTLDGQNVTHARAGSPSLMASAVDAKAQTVTYQAALQLANGSYVHSNVLTVTWVRSDGTSASVGSAADSSGATVCPPPLGSPPQPPARLERVTWVTTTSGARQVTWQDSHFVLFSAVSTGANGCPVVTYQWVDQPISYSHVYPQTVTGFQVTSLYADPGTPFSPVSPTDPQASQQNDDANTDGSAIGGPPLPTFGNPASSPVVYVRVGGALGFRLQWMGSPDDQVVRALAYFTLTNPNGSTRKWTTTLHRLSATAFDAGTTVQVTAGVNGYPPSASVYVDGWTTIPKYATSPALTPVQWNLTGNPATAAILQLTVRVQTHYALITWQKTDLAQLFGYPVWYFNHEIS